MERPAETGIYPGNFMPYKKLLQYDWNQSTKAAKEAP
jgi:hypothetical protein